MRIKLRLKLMTIGAVAASAAIAGCSGSSTSSSTGSTGSAANSGAGNEPARIVSLSPTATEDLYAVGAGRQVVAVDETSNYPAGVPKTSLNGTDPNIEAIARYSPDLVIAAEDSNGLVKSLSKLGIRVLIEPTATSVDDAYAQIEQIGRAAGHAAQATRVTDTMKKRIAADVAKAGGAHRDLSYFWEVSASPYYSATSKTFIGQVAGLFGLKNIADAAARASDGGYPQLSQEYIVAKKPRIIFLTDNEPGDGGQTPAVVAKRPGWSAIPAVKDHEIVPLNDDVASRWGPRLPQLVAAIAQAVERAPGA